MKNNSYEQLVQREKWRKAKAKWRAKSKPPKEERDTSARRHPRAKLTLDEELFVLRDFLTGGFF